MTSAFVFFLIEFIMTSWSKSEIHVINHQNLTVKKKLMCFNIPEINIIGYAFTIFWCLDLIVIISMLPDIPVIATSININYSAGHISNYDYLHALQIIRLIRLFRIIKSYHTIRDNRLKDEEKLQLLLLSQTHTNERSFDLRKEIEIIEKKRLNESRLGAKLAESTTIRVVILILILIVIIPLLMHQSPNHIFSYSTAMLQNINEQSGLPDFIKDACINALLSSLNDQNIPNINLEMTPFRTGAIVNNVNQLNNLPDIAIISESATYYNTTRHMNYYTLADYSNDYFLQIVSRHLIAMMILVCFVTILAIIVINYDTSNLVLKPIAVRINFMILIKYYFL